MSKAEKKSKTKTQEFENKKERVTNIKLPIQSKLKTFFHA